MYKPIKNKYFVFPVIAVMIYCVSITALLAQAKKDISDPVLQEILSFFYTRMPRFIDQHGRNVFVADGPLTRGNFISALYEYDKSLKFGSET